MFINLKNEIILAVDQISCIRLFKSGNTASIKISFTTSPETAIMYSSLEEAETEFKLLLNTLGDKGLLCQ